MGFSLRRFSMLEIQSGPTIWSNRLTSLVCSATQRRGVTLLVTLVNFSARGLQIQQQLGAHQIGVQRGNTVDVMGSIVARRAIRTALLPSSSMIESLRRMASLPGSAAVPAGESDG